LLFRFDSFSQSSRKPMKPKPKVQSSATHTTREERSAKSSVARPMQTRIIAPPIVGVPFFVW
jgi:hypothetical protein